MFLSSEGIGSREALDPFSRCEGAKFACQIWMASLPSQDSFRRERGKLKRRNPPKGLSRTSTKPDFSARNSQKPIPSAARPRTQPPDARLKRRSFFSGHFKIHSCCSSFSRVFWNSNESVTDR